jgi:16S rRNA (cytosine967-C5)-methyltransferase
LIASLARLVGPGGQLVYATCSLEPEETHEVADAFLADHPDFALDALPEWARPFEADGRIQLDPADHAGDGFFALRLRRRGESGAPNRLW